MKLSQSLDSSVSVLLIAYVLAMFFAVMCMALISGANPGVGLIYFSLFLFLQSLWMFPLSVLAALSFYFLFRRTGLKIPIIVQATFCGLLFAVLGHFVFLPRSFVSPTQPWCHDAPSTEGILCMFFFSIFGFQPWFLLALYGCAGTFGGFMAEKLAASPQNHNDKSRA